MVTMISSSERVTLPVLQDHTAALCVHHLAVSAAESGLSPFSGPWQAAGRVRIAG
jgi:hypothetical protein